MCVWVGEGVSERHANRPFPCGESFFLYVPSCLGLPPLPTLLSPTLHARPTSRQGRRHGQARKPLDVAASLAVPLPAKKAVFQNQTSSGPGKQASRQAACVQSLCVSLLLPTHTARHVHTHPKSCQSRDGLSSCLLGEAPSPPLLQAAPPSFPACVHPFCSAFRRNTLRR